MDNTPSPKTRSESNVDESLLSLVPERLREGVLSTPIRGLSVKHGTHRGYRAHGCRCEPCVTFMREYRHNYRLSRVDIERQRDKEMYQQKRLIIDAAKDMPCADCGNRYPLECMDLDHLPERGTKVAAVSRMISSWSIDDIKTEIAKCEAVCSNCHRIRTKTRRDHVSG